MTGSGTPPVRADREDGRAAPITRGELDDGGQAGPSGENFLPVVVAPAGWLHDEPGGGGSQAASAKKARNRSRRA